LSGFLQIFVQGRRLRPDAKLFQHLAVKVSLVIKLFNLFYHPMRIIYGTLARDDRKPTRPETVRLGFLFGEGEV
jgi:hypothetical protein